MKDYYYLLGVDYSATRADIVQAYRKLAAKYHPDRNGGDPFFELRFRELNDAYEVLQDREKRSRYDMEWRFFQDQVRNRSNNSTQEAIAKYSRQEKGILQFLKKWPLPKKELARAFSERRLLYLMATVVLVASIIYPSLRTDVGGFQIALEALLTILISIALSWAIVILHGFVRSRKDEIMGRLLRNIPIYLILICLFRMLVVYHS